MCDGAAPAECFVCQRCEHVGLSTRTWTCSREMSASAACATAAAPFVGRMCLSFLPLCHAGFVVDAAGFVVDAARFVADSI